MDPLRVVSPVNQPSRLKDNVRRLRRLHRPVRDLDVERLRSSSVEEDVTLHLARQYARVVDRPLGAVFAQLVLFLVSSWATRSSPASRQSTHRRVRGRSLLPLRFHLRGRHPSGAGRRRPRRAVSSADGPGASPTLGMDGAQAVLHVRAPKQRGTGAAGHQTVGNVLTVSPSLVVASALMLAIDSVYETERGIRHGKRRR